MRFRYHLQKLVDLKSNEKEQAEWMLSEAVAQLLREETELSGLLEEKERADAELEAAAVETTSVSRVQMLQQYSEHLERQIRIKQGDVKKAQENVAVKRAFLAEKMKEEKAWLKAREKAELQFFSLKMKKEQEQLDEIALTRRMQTI
jgi:flagellar FliJ protein